MELPNEDIKFIADETLDFGLCSPLDGPEEEGSLICPLEPSERCVAQTIDMNILLGESGGRTREQASPWRPLSPAKLEEVMKEANMLAAQLERCKLKEKENATSELEKVPELEPLSAVRFLHAKKASSRNPRRETFDVKNSPLEALLPKVGPESSSALDSPKMRSPKRGSPAPGIMDSPKMHSPKRGSPAPGIMDSPKMRSPKRGSLAPGIMDSPKMRSPKRGSPAPGIMDSPKMRSPKRGSPAPGIMDSPKMCSPKRGSPAPGIMDSPKRGSPAPGIMDSPKMHSPKRGCPAPGVMDPPIPKRTQNKSNTCSADSQLSKKSRPSNSPKSLMTTKSPSSKKSQTTTRKDRPALFSHPGTAQDEESLLSVKPFLRGPSRKVAGASRQTCSAKDPQSSLQDSSKRSAVSVAQRKGKQGTRLSPLQANPVKKSSFAQERVVPLQKTKASQAKNMEHDSSQSQSISKPHSTSCQIQTRSIATSALASQLPVANSIPKATSRIATLSRSAVPGRSSQLKPLSLGVPGAKGSTLPIPAGKKALVFQSTIPSSTSQNSKLQPLKKTTTSASSR